MWRASEVGVSEASRGELFVVAMPIGNPQDLSPRAREVLGAVDWIAAEDTRVARRQLSELGISLPPLVSYHDHNEVARARTLVARLLAGAKVALVSDAGTPLVSDPGYRLVVAAIEHGVPVHTVPGPCAAVAAVAGSGLPPDRFLVLGFLPRDAGRRRTALAQLARERSTLVAYVAPHRMLAVLNDVADALGDRPVAIARNLTKPTEAWFRGSVRAVHAELAQHEEIRGEYTLVIGGAAADMDPDDERVHTLISALVQADVSVGTVRDVVAAVYDLPRRWVYQRALASRRGDGDEAE